LGGRKKIFDLPFSPSNEIGDIFCFELMASKPDNDILTKFCDYLVTNYVEESSRFPPYLWSQVKSERAVSNCSGGQVLIF
jgi:hypothetical protein